MNANTEFRKTKIFLGVIIFAILVTLIVKAADDGKQQRLAKQMPPGTYGGQRLTETDVARANAEAAGLTTEGLDGMMEDDTTLDNEIDPAAQEEAAKANLAQRVQDLGNLIIASEPESQNWRSADVSLKFNKNSGMPNGELPYQKNLLGAAEGFRSQTYVKDSVIDHIVINGITDQETWRNENYFFFLQEADMSKKQYRLDVKVYQDPVAIVPGHYYDAFFILSNNANALPGTLNISQEEIPRVMATGKVRAQLLAPVHLAAGSESQIGITLMPGDERDPQFEKVGNTVTVKATEDVILRNAFDQGRAFSFWEAKNFAVYGARPQFEVYHLKVGDDCGTLAVEMQATNRMYAGSDYITVIAYTFYAEPVDQELLDAFRTDVQRKKAAYEAGQQGAESADGKEAG